MKQSAGAADRDGQEVRDYRIVARRLDDAHPGAATVTTYAVAGSVEETVRKTRTEHEGRLYGVGLYRIVRVEEDLEQEPAEVARLRAFAREALDATRPNTMARRRILEVLGEAAGLCSVGTIELASGDPIVCTREAGHYDPGQRPDGKGDPGGWHHCNASIWDDSSPYSRPHTSA